MGFVQLMQRSVSSLVKIRSWTVDDRSVHKSTWYARIQTTSRRLTEGKWIVKFETEEKRINTSLGIQMAASLACGAVGR